MSGDVIQEEAKGITLKIKVQPNASRNELGGVVDGSLRVRLTAPPVEGAANKECIRFLSKELHIAKSRITIIRGQRGREKVLRIEGMKKEELQKILLAI